MDLNKLTQKSQQAVQRAQEVAVRYGHQELDGEHLLLALVDEPEGLVPRLFQKMDVALDSFRQALGQALERRPGSRAAGPRRVKCTSPSDSTGSREGPGRGEAAERRVRQRGAPAARPPRRGRPHRPGSCSPRGRRPHQVPGRRSRTSAAING